MTNHHFVGRLGEPLNAVDVAKAALCEAGRPDLAHLVKPNKKGWPGLLPPTFEDFPVIAKAFYLAHRSTGHDCRQVEGIVNYRGQEEVVLSTLCRTCWDYWEEHGESLAAP